jgi:hypothetical protein
MPFQNRTLEKLFQGILQDQSVEFRHDVIDRSWIDQAVGYLPLTLSERQKDALYNAWQQEISYIQGPPGTGKSFTIVAIMISAVLLNKKVLFVSQKKAAIEVVRSKLADFLGEEAVIYVGSSADERKQLREYIEQKQAEVNAHTIADRLRKEKADLDNLDQDIASLQQGIDDHKRQLETALNAEHAFQQANDRYLKARDNFIELFGEPEARTLNLRDDVIPQANVELFQRRSRQFGNILASGSIRRKDLLYLRRFYKSCVESLGADRSKFTQQSLGSVPVYVEQLFQLHRSYAESATIQRKITADLNQLRKRIQQQERDSLEKKREYNKRKLQHDLLRNLQQHQPTVEEFRKLLRWVKQERILDCMQRIDYKNLSTVFPLWTGEIKDLGRFLPFQPEVFDLVIVDEASQVNIAEIIPAFYRGKSFCVVGDDKQLSLNAAGLFALNRKFERLVWERCFAGLNQAISYDRARDKALIVSTSSILDFIINEDNHFSIPKVTLDEHFRSMPQLAEFTSKTFYDGNLLIMTAVGKNINKPCFEAVRVGGQREASKKLVPEEIEELVRRLQALIRNGSYLQAPLNHHGFTQNQKPSIGVLSFLTQQRDAIRERLQDEFSEDEWQTYQLLVGTPEEFQGNERNIILITLGLDGLSSRWAKGHYENPNRFNVATSRAINYTYFIYGGIPKTASLLKQYLRHFGYPVHDEDLREPSDCVNPQETPLERKHQWRFDETKVESEFEFKVLEYLREFTQAYGSGNLELYNQVESCHKRLDFVIFNTRNQDCCAVEVDGVHHFTPDGRTYSEEHFSRIEVLKRAGWKIVHVPYHRWYRNGWLCDRDDRAFSSTIKELFDQIKQALDL